MWRDFKTVIKWKKEMCERASIECYFLCNNEGNLILGWPKYLFGFFHKMVWKIRMNFLANPIYTCNFSLSKKHTNNKSETNETAYLQEVGGNRIGKDEEMSVFVCII